MIKILILSAGTNASYHFARILKEKFANDFFIIGADINPKYLIPTGQYLDSFYQVPLSGDRQYYSIVLDICKKEQVNVLLPSFDVDQKLFYPENIELINMGVFSLGTPKETLRIYENKEVMTDFLRNNKLPVPKIFALEKVHDEEEYFIKPKNGVGSIGAKKLKGCDIKSLSNCSDVIIQEVCHKPESTLECFNYNGNLRCITRERIATKAGVCVKSRVYNNEELVEIARNFTLKVKTPLYFNLQFMKDSYDEYVITDVNLRLAGGMSISYACGWDEVSAVARVLLHQDNVFETLRPLETAKFVVRAYQDIVTKG